MTFRQAEEGKDSVGAQRWRWDFKQRIGGWVGGAFLSGMEKVGMEGQ